MYAAHIAAGIAIKAAQPKAPTAAILTAVFLPDLIWLVLALAGVEPVGPRVFFDGWSHSVLSILVQALIAGLAFLPAGRGVATAIGLAVLTHFPLDLPIHPVPLEFYPHASAVVGNFFKAWSKLPSWLGKTHGWWVETDVVLILLCAYAYGSSRLGSPRNVVAASIVLIFWLQIAFG